jgi:hypothetical protein
MMIDKTEIELYNHKFQETLVGKWITIEGTFSMMSDTFEFFQNGQGIWIQASGSGVCKTYFDWKINEPFVINILETKVEYLPDDCNVNSDNNQDDYTDRWNKFEYRFMEITNDCGNEIALCNKDSELFYFAMHRVGLQKETHSFLAT